MVFCKATLWLLLNWNGNYLAQISKILAIQFYSTVCTFTVGIKQQETLWLSSCVCLPLVQLISKASSASAGVQVCLQQLYFSAQMQMTRLHCSHFSLMSFVPQNLCALLIHHQSRLNIATVVMWMYAIQTKPINLWKPLFANIFVCFFALRERIESFYFSELFFFFFF